MVWRVERRSAPAGRSSTGQPSILVGAAHFFPRHFRRELRRLIEPARVVLLEGPLDEEATRKVLAAGRGLGGGELYKAARTDVSMIKVVVPRLQTAVLSRAMQVYGAMGLTPDTPLAFLCHHGNRSRGVAEHFRNKGFRKVYNVRGGIDAWSSEVDPSVPRY